MIETWDKAIQFILSWEGGYVNDPDDAGGETNFGICKRSFPNEDIKNMTRERAMEIYKANYWTPCKCDSLSSPLDIVVFDTAVNMGVGRAQAFLYQTDNWRDYIILRMARYADISSKGNNIKFLRGWINRAVALWKKGKEVV